jgi:hypothetical protein
MTTTITRNGTRWAVRNVDALVDAMPPKVGTDGREYASGRTAGSRGAAPTVTGDATPSKRGVKIHGSKCRWPVRLRDGRTIVVRATDADAAALAVCAVVQAATLRTASRRMTRRADRAARNVAALASALDVLLTREPQARMAGTERLASYVASVGRASAALADATATATETRRCADILSDAYHAWRRWVVLPDAASSDAAPTDAAYVWATDSTDSRPVSVRLRDMRATMNADALATLARL